MSKKKPRILILLVFLFGLSFAMATFIYLNPRLFHLKQTNYGTLIAPPRELREISVQFSESHLPTFYDQSPLWNSGSSLSHADASHWNSFKNLQHHWILGGSDLACCQSKSCQTTLFNLQQLHTALGKKYDRAIVLLLLNQSCQTKLPSLLLPKNIVVGFVTNNVLAEFPYFNDAKTAVWIVDPLSYLILGYPSTPNFVKLYTDLARLLEASQIG